MSVFNWKYPYTSITKWIVPEAIPFLADTLPPPPRVTTASFKRMTPELKLMVLAMP